MAAATLPAAAVGDAVTGEAGVSGATAVVAASRANGGRSGLGLGAGLALGLGAGGLELQGWGGREHGGCRVSIGAGLPVSRHAAGRSRVIRVQWWR